MVRAQSSLSHHRHARSVPRDGLSRACLMFACPQRACGAAPPHGLLATPAESSCLCGQKTCAFRCCCFATAGPAGPRARLPSPQRGGRFTHPALLIACTSVTPPAPPLGQHSHNTLCPEHMTPSSFGCLRRRRLPSFCFLLWLGQPRRLCSSPAALYHTTIPPLVRLSARGSSRNSRGDHHHHHHHHPRHTRRCAALSLLP
jgi:hypothetical protein